MRGAFIAASLALACAGRGPVVPTVPLNEQFTLQRGDAASIGSTGVRLQFLDVPADSRCPGDALCIQAGDATVLVRAMDNTAASDYELHTGIPNRAAETHRQFRVELVRLEPYPFTTRPIQPGDYRATLKVTVP